MKENQNGFLCDQKGCGRDADLLAYEMDNKDEFWKGPEIDCSMIVNDFSKADESEVRDSVTLCTTPSKMELFEKETTFYTDKNVMECELPELIVCYKESTYHVVKDICVDEGVPSKDKILIESCKDGHKGHHIFLPSNGDENSDITKERVDIELLFPDGLKSSSEKDHDRDTANVCGTKERVGVQLLTQTLDGLKSSSEKVYDRDAANVCGNNERVDTELLTFDGLKSSSENDFDQDASNECCSEDSMQKSEANYKATDNVADDVSKENMHTSMLLVQGFGGPKPLRSFLESSDYSGNEVKQVSGQISRVEPVLESPAVVSAAEESTKSNPAGDIFYNSKVESGAITFDFNSTTLAESSTDKRPETVDRENTLKPENVPNHGDGISDSLSVASQVQHGLGESSFSAAGVVSGRITYSGPIAYSGSVSLRSDSSTASTRSFAFPILQSEWNSSPVRMVKADRSRFPKHRAHDPQFALTTLPRKLRLLEEATLTGHGGEDFVSYNKQKEAFSGKQQEKEADMMHASKGTWKEWVERTDTSQFFTMDYSHVRRRRPIHNKFVPVGP
ncbi:hypothetical protein F0562_033031 [Nyssa sinensis]|uniref:Uncharacterized protein n=1 Tax=Nyssa sinensis TaxID=561372 RepID=A0A5J5AT01_9ASTE|nr:hypothetical protein F0562_033031 [Nyssa sinensis]